MIKISKFLIEKINSLPYFKYSYNKYIDTYYHLQCSKCSKCSDCKKLFDCDKFFYGLIVGNLMGFFISNIVKK